jgi:hypothetical protein
MPQGCNFVFLLKAYKTLKLNKTRNKRQIKRGQCQLPIT